MPKETTPLIIESGTDNAIETASPRSTSIKKALDRTGETMTTFLTTQALSARWFYQLFLVMRNNQAGLSEKTEKLLNELSPIIPALLTLWTTYDNHQKRKDGKQVSAPDKARALFSSSFVLMMLDVIQPKDKTLEENAALFTAFTLTAIVVSLSSAKHELSTASDHSIIDKDYKEAITDSISKTEKAYNTVSRTIKDGLTPLFMSWVIRREVSGHTEDSHYADYAVTGAFMTMIAILAYQQHKNPKRMDQVSLASRVMKNMSLSYAAMSGLMFEILMQYCSKQNDNSLPEPDLTKSCLEHPGTRAAAITICCIFAAIVGIHTFFRTGIQFKETHEKNAETVKSMEDNFKLLGDKIKSTANSAKDFLKSCYKKPKEDKIIELDDDDASEVEKSHSRPILM